MTKIQEGFFPEIPTNEEIIKKYISRFKRSERSWKSRKYAIQYFFEERYFGYKGHVFDIKKYHAIDFFDYLNNKNDICLTTKKNKWNTFRSFLQFIMEYYDNFVIVIPTVSVHWGAVHKESQSNKDVAMDREEIKKVLNHCLHHHYHYYIVFRLFAETGMRMGELRNIKLKGVHLDRRYVETIGKRGRVVYYFSKGLAKHLALYIKEREMTPCECDALFISCRKTPCSERAINSYLIKVARTVGITENVSSHTFRKSLNTERKRMGCLEEDRCILVNHKVSGVNYNCYVKLRYDDFIALYDRWYPFGDLF